MLISITFMKITVILLTVFTRGFCYHDKYEAFVNYISQWAKL